MNSPSQIADGRIESQPRTARPSLKSLRQRWVTMLERRRQRIALLQLDDRMLEDIGVSRVDALREGSKPFWRD